MEKFINNYCIVRGDRSGVFFGVVKSVEGQTVEMENVRKLHYWDGAFAVEGLASDGVLKAQNCRFTVVVDSILVTDVIQILACTDRAIKNLKEVSVWQF